MSKTDLSTKKVSPPASHQDSVILSFKSLFNLIGKDLHQQICHQANAYNLTPMQSFIILHLQEAEDHKNSIYQKDLEALFHISGSTVTGLLKLMEQKNLLSRHSVPHDARLKEIRLTTKAKNLLSGASQKLSLTEEKINHILTLSERKTLLKIIKKIQTQFHPTD